MAVLYSHCKCLKSNEIQNKSFFSRFNIKHLLLDFHEYFHKSPKRAYPFTPLDCRCCKWTASHISIDCCFLWKDSNWSTKADVEVLAHPGDKYCEDRQDDVNSFFTSCFITLGSFIITSTLKVHTHFQASVKSRS